MERLCIACYAEPCIAEDRGRREQKEIGGKRNEIMKRKKEKMESRERRK